MLPAELLLLIYHYLPDALTARHYRQALNWTLKDVPSIEDYYSKRSLRVYYPYAYARHITGPVVVSESDEAPPLCTNEQTLNVHRVLEELRHTESLLLHWLRMDQPSTVYYQTVDTCFDQMTWDETRLFASYVYQTYDVLLQLVNCYRRHFTERRMMFPDEMHTTNLDADWYTLIEELHGEDRWLDEHRPDREIG